MVILRACVRCGRLSEQSRCPEHRRKAWATDRTRRLRKGSGWQQQQRARKVISAYNGICHCCGATGARIADHVIALADGGTDDESNLRPICDACNRLKVGQEAARGRARAAARPADESQPREERPR